MPDTDVTDQAFTHVDFTYDTERGLTVELDAMRESYPALTFTVVQKSGPAGGWPVIRLEGPRPVVARALREGWNVDELELWSVYGIATANNHACVVKATFDKLERTLNALHAEGWLPTPHFVGGRDWVITCLRDE